MISKPKIEHKVVSIEPSRMPRTFKARLSCGEYTLIEQIDDKLIDITSGTLKKGVWSDWTGTEVQVGSLIRCHECSKTAYKALLDARPITQAAVVASRDEIIAIKGNDDEYGPVKKYKIGDRVVLCAQIYLGAHNWIAVNTNDLREVWVDPGWDGTEYGWAVVPKEHIKYAFDAGITEETPPPEREGKPITCDQFLFADKEKLESYLGPDDPLLKRSNK